METIGATEARANFAELLRRVSVGGERIVIERRGKPRAVLVPLGAEERDDPQTAGASLRKTDALFDETERLARLGHWEWDEVEDRCTYCSEELVRLHGVTVEEFLRRASSQAGDLEWVHPKDRQRYLDATSKLRDKGKGFQIEYRLRQPGGNYLEVREVSKPVFGDRGSVIRSYGFVQDITERKQAEREQHRINALFNKAESLAKLGHLEWDWVEDRCAYCSEELAHLHGVTAEQYIEKATFEADTQWVHPEDRAAYWAAFERMNQQGEEYEIEYRLLQPGGGWIEAREVMELEVDDTGTVVRSFGFVQDITERKQTEKELHRTNLLFEETERLATLGHWEWDEVEDRCTYCSEELARLHGVTVEEYLDRASSLDADLEWIHPEDRTAYRATVDEMHRLGKGFEIEYRLLQPGGGWIEVREVSEVVLDDAGAVARSFGFVQDLTERKQAEATLRASEAALAKAQQLAHIGSWRWSIERDELISASEECARIHGVGLDRFREHIRHQMERVIHPEDRDRVGRAFKRFDAEGSDYEIEYRIVRPDGDVRYVLEIGEAAPDDTGRTVEHVGSVQDVTDFKRVEEELRRARDELELRVAERTAALQEKSAQLQSILDHSPAMIFLEDAEGRYVMANRVFERLFGTTDDALAGKRPEEVLPPGLAESSRAQDLEVLRTGRPSTKEETFVIDGRERTLLTSKFPVLDDADELIGIGTVATDITERKQAEQEAERSRALLAAAVEALDDGFVIFDDDDRMVLCNSTYRDIYRPVGEAWEPGVSLEEVARDTARHCVGLEDEGEVEASVRQRLEQHQKLGVPFEQELRDGRWIRAGEYPLPNGWTVGTRSDITELKRTEEELRQTLAYLQHAQRIAKIDYWVWDSKEMKNTLTAHDSGILGALDDAALTFSDEEYIERFVHPEDRNRVLEAYDSQSAKEYEVDIEYRIIRMDGEIRVVHEVGERLFNGAEEPVTLFGTLQDITAIRKTEDELRESERRYRELFDESPVAIWVEDWSPIKQMLDDLARDGVKDWRGYFNSHRDQLRTAYGLAEILEISRATIKLYHEESKEDLVGRSAATVVVEEEFDAFLEILLPFLAGQMAVEIEAKDVDGDGTEIIVRRRVAIPPKYRDDWSRVIYAIEDITERARVEEQLRQAQKMEAVGQLTGGVAHDFNNLLAVVLGNTELLSLKVGEDDPKIQAVIRAATRGGELTQRLLAFSRKQTLQPQVVEVNALVGGMIDLLGRTLGETIEIKTSSVPGLWRAIVDPGQLENALLNLAINARDAMPQGGTLVIEAGNANLDEAYARNHSDFTPGDYVMLAVSDSGSGMSPEILERALEPFFTTKEVGEGSGLGLAMVYGFAKQSDGHVVIYSEQGHGTTVKLYLPRTEAPADVPGPAEEEAPRGRGETVLLVEDNADVRQLAERLLEDLGYRVFTAEDARAALGILDRIPRPDLLLSDVVLPGGVSGPDLAKHALERYPGLEVLFMSGYAEHAARTNGLAEEGAELLNKPFRKRDLALKLRAVLDRKR